MFDCHLLNRLTTISTTSNIKYSTIIMSKVTSINIVTQAENAYVTNVVKPGKSWCYLAVCNIIFGLNFINFLQQQIVKCNDIH